MTRQSFSFNALNDDAYDDSAFEWTFSELSMNMKKIIDDDAKNIQVKPNLYKPIQFYKIGNDGDRPSLESSQLQSDSKVDKLGVHDYPPEELHRLKQGVTRWDFDLFATSRLTDGHVMQAVAHEISIRHSLLQDLKIVESQFMRFIIQVERHYRRNPYHNASHAADVLQTVYCIVLKTGFLDLMTPLEFFTILVTAAVHDIEHTGTNNLFHKNTGSEMAKLYVVSIQENHHLRVGLRMAQEHELLKNCSKTDFAEFKFMMTAMILATDMSNHFLLLTNMKLIVDTTCNNQNRLRIQRIMMLVLHAADISNPAKNWDQHKVWVTLLCEEFFKQGDKEKELQLPISPSCDRNVANIATLQIGFMQTFTKETYDVMDALLDSTLPKPPAGQPLVPFTPWQTCMQENLNKWSGKWKSLKYEQINELLCETERPRMSIALSVSHFSKTSQAVLKPEKKGCAKCCGKCCGKKKKRGNDDYD